MEHHLYNLLACARDIAADLDGGRMSGYYDIYILIERAREMAAKRATDMEMEDPAEDGNFLYDNGVPF
jgi:hypothetical protein